MTIKVIGTEHIAHESGAVGPRVCKIETVETVLDGVATITEVNYWYQIETGRLLYVR